MGATGALYLEYRQYTLVPAYILRVLGNVSRFCTADPACTASISVFETAGTACVSNSVGTGVQYRYSLFPSVYRSLLWDR